MSIMAASTHNQIGVRPIKNRLALGVVRYPGESRPVTGFSSTQLEPGATAPAAHPGAPPAPPHRSVHYNTHAAQPAHARAAHNAAQHSPVHRRALRGLGLVMVPTATHMLTPTSLAQEQQLPVGAQSGQVANQVLPNPAAASFAPSTTMTASPYATAPTVSIVNPPSAVPAATALSPATAGLSTSPAVFPGTSVPLSQPESAPYVDAAGNTWTWNGSTWVVTATAGSSSLTAAGATTSPSVTTTVDTGIDISAITTWLQSSTIIGSVPNFFLVAGVGLAGVLLLSGRGSGKR